MSVCVCVYVCACIVCAATVCALNMVKLDLDVLSKTDRGDNNWLKDLKVTIAVVGHSRRYKG